MANIWNNTIVDAVFTAVFGWNWHPDDVTTAFTVVAAVAVVTAVVIWAIKAAHKSSLKRWGQ